MGRELFHCFRLLLWLVLEHTCGAGKLFLGLIEFLRRMCKKLVFFETEAFCFLAACFEGQLFPEKTLLESARHLQAQGGGFA